ncbi:hypothetical protein PMAYCL1PPCAC_22730, partial [Pristionchus mayeri]
MSISIQRGDEFNPRQEFYLNGHEDQVSNQLSTFITRCEIHGEDFTPSDFSLCADILRNSTFGRLTIYVNTLDDNSASFILSLAPHSKDISVCCGESSLPDPAIFITQLASSDGSSTFLSDISSSATS